MHDPCMSNALLSVASGINNYLHALRGNYNSATCHLTAEVLRCFMCSFIYVFDYYLFHELEFGFFYCAKFVFIKWRSGGQKARARKEKNCTFSRYEKAISSRTVTVYPFNFEIALSALMPFKL